MFVNFNKLPYFHFMRRVPQVSPGFQRGKHTAILTRLGRALNIPGTWDSQTSRQSAHESFKVVSHTHRPSLTPGNIPDTDFCYRLSQSQGHRTAENIMSVKISNDIFGNRTLRLVAQCFNQMHHRNSQRDRL